MSARSTCSRSPRPRYRWSLRPSTCTTPRRGCWRRRLWGSAASGPSRPFRSTSRPARKGSLPSSRSPRRRHRRRRKRRPPRIGHCQWSRWVWGVFWIVHGDAACPAATCWALDADAALADAGSRPAYTTIDVAMRAVTPPVRTRKRSRTAEPPRTGPELVDEMVGGGVRAYSAGGWPP